jgi:anti-anti-sigma regulatory factor
VIQRIDVHEVLQRQVSGVYADLVTRPTGRAVREEIERTIAGVEARVTVIDFTHVGCVDYSCADEIVAKLLRDARVILLLRGINDGHREAIEHVVRSAGLAVVLEGADGSLDVLGSPDAAAQLLDQLVALQLAARTPGGGFFLTAA